MMGLPGPSLYANRALSWWVSNPNREVQKNGSFLYVAFKMFPKGSFKILWKSFSCIDYMNINLIALHKIFICSVYVYILYVRIWEVIGNACIASLTMILFSVFFIQCFFQAIGPELTFYSKSRNAEQQTLSNKLLHAQMDASCR